MCFILTVKQSQRRWRHFEVDDYKKVVNFFEEKSAPGDLAPGCSDLEITWMLCWAGASTECYINNSTETPPIVNSLWLDLLRQY